MAYFEYDGKQIYYDSVGDGEPLLLLHGNTTSSKLFKDDIPFFKQFYKVIYFDFPGHGHSERLDRFPDNYWRYVGNCGTALLKYLEIEYLKGIGTSGGALAGLNMAAADSSLFSHFIADSFLGLHLSKDEAVRIAEGRKSKLNETMYVQYWKAFNGDDWKSVVENDIDMIMRAGESNEPLIEDGLSNLHSKVLLTATSTDELIPSIKEKTDEVAKLIPNSVTRYYDRGRHTFMITEKETFQRLAIDFFEDKLI